MLVSFLQFFSEFIHITPTWGAAELLLCGPFSSSTRLHQLPQLSIHVSRTRIFRGQLDLGLQSRQRRRDEPGLFCPRGSVSLLDNDTF